MGVLDDLKAARAVIADPAHWAQRGYALDARGFTVSARSRVARRFCTLGAVRRLGLPRRRERAATDFLMDQAPGLDVPLLNDNGTHADVMALYDRAIAAAEARAA